MSTIPHPETPNQVYAEFSDEDVAKRQVNVSARDPIVEEEKSIFRKTSRLKFMVFIATALTVAVLLVICNESI